MKVEIILDVLSNTAMNAWLDLPGQYLPPIMTGTPRYRIKVEVPDPRYAETVIPGEVVAELVEEEKP
jgi:translation initiation factor 2 alpha subunit (eIF-2alpha)